MARTIGESIRGSKTAVGLWVSCFVLMSSLLATATYGQTTGQTEGVLIRQMPGEITSRMASGNRPDANGMIGHNRSGWMHVVFQRGAMIYLTVAAAQGNQSQVTDAWRAVDVSFIRQTTAGNFETGLSVPRIDDLSGVSFWLAKFCHAALVLQGSSVGPYYQSDIAQLLPQVREAATWLAQGRNELASAGADAPNRLFFHACAFGLAGILLNDNNFKQIGRDFVEMGLASQREDGVFVEHGGYDSSYQGTSLLQLQQYAIHNPGDPAIEEAIRRGAEWELTRIEWNGEVNVEGNTRTGSGQEEFMGEVKGVNYPEVILALLYYGARNNSRYATNAAIRVYQYVTGQARTVRWTNRQRHYYEDPDELDPTIDDFDPDRTLAGIVTLDNNYPNPCTEGTVISYSVPAGRSMRLTIYDVHGREIRTLVDGSSLAGRSEVLWDATDSAGNRVSPGIYVCRLTTEDHHQSRKISVVE